MIHPASTLAPAQAPPPFELDAAPRCDRDTGEAAAVAVHTSAGPLYLCGHHFREHWDGLLKYETTMLAPNVHPFPFRIDPNAVRIEY